LLNPSRGSVSAERYLVKNSHLRVQAAARRPPNLAIRGTFRMNKNARIAISVKLWITRAFSS
jgi:hypothetical protein